MSDRIYQQFAYFSGKIYKNIETYPIQDDLLKEIRHEIPMDWNVYRSGVWQYFCDGKEIPVQGWKIHISADYSNRIKIAKQVIKILLSNNISFKILVDNTGYNIINSKIQNRGSSGKFITIYPPNDECFIFIIEELYKVLQNEVGPYILSDRRYKDCKCIYYRYGAFKPILKKEANGHNVYSIIDCNGQLVEDGRHAYCDFPSWIVDPFVQEEWYKKNYSKSNDELLKGRYRIISMIHFSNTGGVYKAFDTMKNQIVAIKEARPYTQSNGVTDSIKRLENEKNFLIKFQDNYAIPRYVDYFCEWEHQFLVMEFIDGNYFAKFINRNSPLSNVEIKFKKMYLEKLIDIWQQIARAYNKIHVAGWCVGDISLNNIMIEEREDNYKARIIDFESSFFSTKKIKNNIATFGFTSNNNSLTNFEKDIYAFVSTIFASIFPINSIFGLMNELEKKKIRKYYIAQLGMQPELELLFDDVLSENFYYFKTMNDIVYFLEFYLKITKSRDIVIDNTFASTENIIDFKMKLLNGLKQSINYRNPVSLIPCDPNAFVSSNIAVKFGCAGIIHTLKYVEKEVPNQLAAWILQKDLKNEALGLHCGLSGIAWVMIESGYYDFGCYLMKYILNHVKDSSDISIAFGKSGIALTLIYIYETTKNIEWLKNAEDLTKEIMNEINAKKMLHQANSKEIELGLYYGISGIAYLFLEIYQSTKKDIYLDYLSVVVKNLLNKVTICETHASIIINKNNEKNVLSPYLSNGTSGVLFFLLRYFSAFKDLSIVNLIKMLLNDLLRPVMPFCSLEMGMAGIANVLLDASLILKDETFLNAARKYITTIEFNAVHDDLNNLSIPAHHLYKISNDYLTGSSGVVCLLERYIRIINNDQDNFNFDFTLDKFRKYY